MTPEEHLNTCCVIKCLNTPLNSKVKFFSIPEAQCRLFLRNKWVQAIKRTNGRWWTPSAHSLVCGDHFVTGQPSADCQDTDYVPSVFNNKRKEWSTKSHAVSVKKFALEYIKHDALLEKHSRTNSSNDQRKCAYVKLAAALGIQVSTVRSWERRFRDYIELRIIKMADAPDKRKPSADGKSHWLTTVAKRLFANPVHPLSAQSGGGVVSPGGVVATLCAAARARGALCSTTLYTDVRRVLRLSINITELHAIWVSAQRVSLQQVLVAGRAGDAAHAAPPAAAAEVADLVLLHTDVDIVTDESVTLYEESAALHTLWQLIQRHRIEDAAPAHSRVRAQRWTRAHRSYLDSGRTVSLVVLQRRWYELKLQARVRLAMHWRRPPALQLFDDLTPAPNPAPDPAPTPTTTPQEHHPRPAPLHIAILKRYPHIATGQFKSWRQQVLEGTIVTEPLEEDNDVKETRSNNNEQSTDTTDTGNDATVKQLYSNMSKIEQPKFDEPMVEQSPDNDPLAEVPTVTDLLEEENYVKETKSNVDEQSADTKDTGDNAVVKQLYPNMSKVEQPIDSGSLTDNHVAEQTTDHDLLAVQRTVADPLPEPTMDSDLLAVQRTVNDPKIEQRSLLYDALINQSTVYTLAESPVGHVGNAATANIPDMLDAPDIQGGLDISSEQIHRTEDKSNEVIPPKPACSSDTDTDTENYLVIDECSNKTPCSLKREPVPHTETHSFDSVSPHAPLGSIAPTIEVLHMIDPNTVKTEILFESDEDDFQPCNEVDTDEIELDANKEVSFIRNRLMFADEEPKVSCDVLNEDDVTARMDWEDGQKMDDPVNDTPTIDPKLLMDTQIRIFRIDKIRAWKNNVRKDNSIRVSRIHKRYYTPKTKIKCNNTKTHTQNTPSDVELRTSDRLTTATSMNTQEIRGENSCLDKVANTHSIRQFCENIKQELMEEQLDLLEGKTPKKKAKTESDAEDDNHLLVLREEKPQRETDVTQDTVVREMVEESSSDDELLNDEMFHQQALAGRSNKLGGEERKRRRGAYYAASTIEWSSDFAPMLERVAKRVSLPNIEQVRRYNSGIQVAQVAPISSTVGAYGDDAMQAGQPPGDAAADHTPEAWSALDLPAADELQAALDDLTAAPAAEAGLERSHCCAARRHREVNDTRRHIGLDEIPLHNHPDGVCACCCAHLSDADVRLHLDQQLRALHEDIEQMLRMTRKKPTWQWKKQKSAGGKIQSKPAQNTRSPSPAQASTSATTATAATSTHKQTTPAHKLAKKDAPSNTATEAKGSKAKLVTYVNRSKRSRTRARAPPDPAPAPLAPPVSDYEEWQRQKNMNAKYFHINSNVSSKKDKSTTAQGSAVQSTTAQVPAVESTTAQATPAQSCSPQAAAVQSTTAQTATKQNIFIQNASPQQNVIQPGLMPYIRQSRLVNLAEESPRVRCAIPNPPLCISRLVKIAPKPDMGRASEHAQHSTVVDKPAITKEGTKNLTLQPYQPHAASTHRMNIMTEQVSESTQPIQPITVTSESTSKPVSILEEYSRTLSIEPVNNIPVVNALSLRVPNGQQGPKTTIVMALTLPSDHVIKETINRLYANETVDLTEEPETSNSDITKIGSKHQINTPFDLVGAAKMLNKNKSCGSLLKPLSASKSCKSLLKSIYSNVFDKPPDTTESPPTAVSRNKAPKIMSLSNKLYDGDVIEIDDTDSNHSNSSDGNQSSNSNRSSISINKSCNPAVYTNKGPNQTTSKTDDSSNQVVSNINNSNEAVSNTNNSNEAVSNTNENYSSEDYYPDWNSLLYPTKSSDQATEDKNNCSSQASTADSTKQAIDKGTSSRETSMQRKCAKERYKNRLAKRRTVSEAAVSSHSVARPCSRIPVLLSLTDGSRRCPARCANVAAMTDFMATLRRAAAQADKEVYCHKVSAVELPVSALPCGGTLLCVDGTRPPLVLPACYQRHKRDRATPNARAHLVLTDADLPCALPTYWTLASFGQMARVMPNKLLGNDAADEADAEARGGCTRWCDVRKEWVPIKENRKICEKNHNFKILTAFCSADGVRQAARAGASLLLLSVLRARVVVLTLQRSEVSGVVRHRASADVEEELLRELEGLLDKAEIDEQLAGGADIIGQ